MPPAISANSTVLIRNWMPPGVPTGVPVIQPLDNDST